MNEIDAINALTMCHDLILFDPMTGETSDIRLENRDNQDLYYACELAIAALREKMERGKGCDWCKGGAYDLFCENGFLGGIENGYLVVEHCGQKAKRKIAVCPICDRKLEVKKDE